MEFWVCQFSKKLQKWKLFYMEKLYHEIDVIYEVDTITDKYTFIANSGFVFEK